MPEKRIIFKLKMPFFIKKNDKKRHFLITKKNDIKEPLRCERRLPPPQNSPTRRR
ncbi:MAG: hypothetical protein RL757_2532 [Bacteroidota bacterium]|jgi:hypothetical protein